MNYLASRVLSLIESASKVRVFFEAWVWCCWKYLYPLKENSVLRHTEGSSLIKFLLEEFAPSSPWFLLLAYIRYVLSLTETSSLEHVSTAISRSILTVEMHAEISVAFTRRAESGKRSKVSRKEVCIFYTSNRELYIFCGVSILSLDIFRQCCIKW